MANLLRGMAARVGRMAGRTTAPHPVTAHTPAQVARRRQVRALRRRQLAYAPQLDGQADPGEIVWTWVAYEDNPRQGKDRPVLVVGRQSRTLFGLMLGTAGPGPHHAGGQHPAGGCSAGSGPVRPGMPGVARRLRLVLTSGTS